MTIEGIQDIKERGGEELLNKYDQSLVKGKA
jgi:hypothetical protein